MALIHEYLADQHPVADRWKHSDHDSVCVTDVWETAAGNKRSPSVTTDLEDFASQDLFTRHAETRSITNRLVATSFYFEVDSGSVKTDDTGGMSLRGHIRCRFQQSSAELRSFGRLLLSRIAEIDSVPLPSRHSPCFVIQDTSRPQEAHQVLLKGSVLADMQSHGRFTLGAIPLEMKNAAVDIDIYLRFGNEDDKADQNSISGFPRCWGETRRNPMPSWLSSGQTKTRQRSRRSRPEWIEPTSRSGPLLGRYVRQRNPGLASDEEMLAVHDRLKVDRNWRVPLHEPDESLGLYELPDPYTVMPLTMSAFKPTTWSSTGMVSGYRSVELDSTPISEAESIYPSYRGQSQKTVSSLSTSTSVDPQADLSSASGTFAGLPPLVNAAGETKDLYGPR